MADQVCAGCARPAESRDAAGDDRDPRAREPRLSRGRSEEHTSELQSQSNLVCRLPLEKKKPTSNSLNPTAHDALLVVLRLSSAESPPLPRLSTTIGRIPVSNPFIFNSRSPTSACYKNY